MQIKEIKEILINELKERYPQAISAEFNFYMAEGLTENFSKLLIVNDRVEKKVVTASLFYQEFEKHILSLIDQNNIIGEEEINDDIEGLFTIDLVHDTITLDFYKMISDKEYLGVYKL